MYDTCNSAPVREAMPVDPMNISTKMKMTLEVLDKVNAMLNEISFRLNGLPEDKRDEKPVNCMIDAVDGLLERSEMAACKADKILEVL